jgi:hypothetical protein
MANGRKRRFELRLDCAPSVPNSSESVALDALSPESFLSGGISPSRYGRTFLGSYRSDF